MPAVATLSLRRSRRSGFFLYCLRHGRLVDRAEAFPLRAHRVRLVVLRSPGLVPLAATHEAVTLESPEGAVEGLQLAAHGAEVRPGGHGVAGLRLLGGHG